MIRSTGSLHHLTQNYFLIFFRLWTKCQTVRRRTWWPLQKGHIQWQLQGSSFCNWLLRDQRGLWKKPVCNSPTYLLPQLQSLSMNWKESRNVCPHHGLWKNCNQAKPGWGMHGTLKFQPKIITPTFQWILFHWILNFVCKLTISIKTKAHRIIA